MGIFYCDFCKKYNLQFFPEDEATRAIFNEEGFLDAMLCETHFLAVQQLYKRKGKKFTFQWAKDLKSLKKGVGGE